MDPSDRIFVALDTSDLDKALALAEGLRGLVGGVKLGQEFFTAQGPAGAQPPLFSFWRSCLPVLKYGMNFSDT